MKKSILYLFALSFILINCGSESKANPVHENISETEETIITNKPTSSETTEAVLEETELIQTQPTEKAIQIEEKTNIEIKDETVKHVETTNTTEEEVEIIKEVVEVIVTPVFNHETFDKLLRKYVTSSGKVNYSGFKSESRSLAIYIKELQTEYANIDSWSKNKKLAFWINVYNAHTIKLIVDNYPVTSITKLKGGKPWDYKFISLGDKTYTLNEIENDIIRPKFNEPRIHFAVNCAAKSCPKLMNKAWTESNINSSLTTQTKAFLANTSENTLGANEVKISKIFEWYNADFIKSGSLISFIKKYSSTTINDDAKVSYNEYNWNLNE